MARAKWCGEESDDAASAFKERCLIRDESLIAACSRAPAHVALPDVTADLAARFHLSAAWLERLLGLLTEKKQPILYGPPGSGLAAGRLDEFLAPRYLEGRPTEVVPFPVSNCSGGASLPI